LPVLDRVDHQIIQILNQDARTSSANIARLVNIPERTVHHRIRRLLEGGYIRAVAVVNPKAFGYSIAVDIFCEIELDQMQQATAALMDMPEISYMAISTGDQDLSIQALFKDIDEMQDFITRKLHQVPGMRRTRTVLIPRIVKDTYHWLPPEEHFSSTSKRPENSQDLEQDTP
jgi:Lrp/AsnC family transcriptional regulator, regulator for asnA, asnC and gidA